MSNFIPAICPTCGLPPEKGHASSDAHTMTTALYACPLGHQWAVRWAIYCSVCRAPLAQDFDPCASDDGPVDRCEPCDMAICDAYAAGLRGDA